MLEEIGGLPAHPLIIHLPLVLGPLVGVLTLALLVPAWRDRLFLPTAGLAVVFAVFAALAVKSGQNLAGTMQIGSAIGEHADAGKNLRLLGIILAAALVVVALVRSRLNAPLQTVAGVAIAALGVATVGYTVKTGHEGAKVVWEAPFEAAKEAQQAQESGGADDSGDDSADESGDDSGGSGDDTP